MVSQFNNELQSNHVSPSRNQLAGMVSEPLGKGINKLVIPRKRSTPSSPEIDSRWSMVRIAALAACRPNNALRD